MTMGMMIWAVGAGALVTVMAYATVLLRRRADRGERWVWTGALLLVGVASVMPMIPATTASAGPRNEFTAVELTVPAGTTAPAPRFRRFDAMARWTRRVASSPIPGFGTVWLSVSALLLTAGLAAEGRQARRRRRLPRTRVWGLPVGLDGREGPAVSGVLRPLVVLPPRALALPRDQRRTLVTHEMEHLRGGDVRLLASAYVAVALVPWNPFVWVLARRVALGVEADCDRRTLRRRRTTPSEYARLLLEVATWQTGSRPRALRAAMGSEARSLRARVDRILDRNGRRPIVHALLLMGGAVAVSPALGDPPRYALSNEATPASGVFRFTGDESAPALATATFSAGQGPSTLSRRGEASPVVEAGPAGRLRPADRPGTMTLRLPPITGGTAAALRGRGAFRVWPGTDGEPSRVETEVASGGAFEEVAVTWLSRAEFESDRPSIRVWVAAAEGRWSATPVSPELYARNALDTDPAALRRLLDTWADLREAAPGVSVAAVTADSSRIDP